MFNLIMINNSEWTIPFFQSWWVNIYATSYQLWSLIIPSYLKIKNKTKQKHAREGKPSPNWSINATSVRKVWSGREGLSMQALKSAEWSLNADTICFLIAANPEKVAFNLLISRPAIVKW